MQRKPASICNKLVVACAFLIACVLAVPTASAHDGRYRHSSNRGADVLGALVVGAVIGGVLVGASQNHRDYYNGGYSYPARAYPPAGYYGGYPAYSYGNAGYAYPSYGNSGYAYPSYGYGSSVNVGVIYSNRGDRSRYGYNRGRSYYGGSRGYSGNRGNYGHRGRHGGRHQGSQGHYYQRHGH